MKTTAKPANKFSNSSCLQEWKTPVYQLIHDQMVLDDRSMVLDDQSIDCS